MSPPPPQSHNVLLDGAGAAKLADFGLARLLPAGYLTGSGSAGAEAGTFAYCAPEVLMGQRSTAKADVYSLGVLLCECCGTKGRAVGVLACCPERMQAACQGCLPGILVGSCQQHLHP